MRFRRLICLLTLTAATGCLLPAQAKRISPDEARQRRALIIGNEKYPWGPLTNPVNDARAMESALKEYGFRVNKVENGTRSDILAAVRIFVDQVRPNDAVVVYYSGHGVQIGGENFLIPVDLNPRTETEVRDDAINVHRLLRDLEGTGSRLRVLILDSCRDNPLRGSKSGQRGLARMEGGRGTIIAFATSEGETADDSRGKSNSIYTRELLVAISEKANLEEALRTAQRRVDRASGGKQVPAIYSKLLEDFYLWEGGSAVVAPVDREQAAREAYDEIRTSSRPEDFEQLANLFAGTAWGSRAKLRAGVLRRPSPPAGPVKGDVRENGTDGQRYVYVPAGKFQMGCSEGDGECGSAEKPRREVEITKGFWLGQTEVSVEAYQRFASANRRAMPAEPNFNGTALNPGWSKGKMPMVNVDWAEAKAYCEWAGGRLPSEAEWEYAARGETTGARYGKLEQVAWFGDNARKTAINAQEIWEKDQKNYVTRLHQNGNGFRGAGLKSPNGYGLYDMLGNVWEWTEDWYGEASYQGGERRDPKGPPNGEKKVLRGGSWGDDAGYPRASVRFRVVPSVRNVNIGLRCAWD